jgi:predicted Zn-dependent peptidase
LKRRTLLAMVLLAGCTQTPRLVAPLRYPADLGNREVHADESLRSTQPEVGTSATPLRCPIPQAATLSNGARLFVVERHAFPSVSARLVFASTLPEWDAPGATRVELMGATFLSPIEVGEDVRVGCSSSGCSLSVLGTRDELDEMLGRLATLVVSPREPREAYARRLRSSIANFRLSGALSTTQLSRNTVSAVFGDPPYADTRRTDFPLEELERIRDSLLRPESATLLIAGDVSFDDARSAAERSLGSWRARGSVGVRPTPAHRTLGAGPQVVLVNHEGLALPLGAIVVRGPARGDPDAASAAVAVHILGGGASSTAFQTVREDMSAAYVVEGHISWWPETSILFLGGQFDPQRTPDALAALLRSLRALRQHAPVEADLIRAKAAIGAGLVRQLSSNDAITASLVTALITGGPLDLCDFDKRVDAVSAEDVWRFAAKYFDEDNLHLVAVGEAGELAGPLAGLGLGRERLRDGFGQDVRVSSE